MFVDLAATEVGSSPRRTDAAAWGDELDPARWDDGLDDAQLAVATHGEGPLVVVAGAGTGKTRALISRVACLLDRGVAPHSILLLTFTRRAADEMLARALNLVGTRGDGRPRGGTFHAVAYRHVAAHAPVLDLPEGFGVLDPAGAQDLMDLLRVEQGLSGTATRFPRPATLVDIYSRCVNTQRPLRSVVPAEYPWCAPHLEAIGELFRSFTSRKRSSALLDFDDLLLFWRRAARNRASSGLSCRIAFGTSWSTSTRTSTTSRWTS